MEQNLKNVCWYFKLKNYRYKDYQNSYDVLMLLNATSFLELVV